MLSAWRVRGLGLDGPVAVPELALRRLGRRVVWVAVDLATGDELSTAVTSKHLASLVTADAAEDLDQERVSKAFDIEFDRWADHVKTLAADSASLAQVLYKKKFAEQDIAFCEHMRRTADEVKRKRPDEGKNYIRERRLTAQAIEGAILDLDVIGLLKIDSA
jgi:hypothetical protein